MEAGEIFERIVCNDVAAVTDALHRDSSLAAARDPGLGSTPLHFAAHRGFAEIVTALLDAGADVRARETVNDSTPLHWAAEGGHPGIVRTLLARGADREAIDGWHGLSPLGWAVVVAWAPHFHEDRAATASWTSACSRCTSPHLAA